MKVVGWGNLQQLPVRMKHLKPLQVLSLEGCSALHMLTDRIGELSALRLLLIDRCSDLQCLTALRSLSITQFVFQKCLLHCLNFYYQLSLMPSHREQMITCHPQKDVYKMVFLISPIFNIKTSSLFRFYPNCLS
jgi:hypothetical protein